MSISTPHSTRSAATSQSGWLKKRVGMNGEVCKHEENFAKNILP